MGSYRDAYPYGGASASAAYHYFASPLDGPSLYGERLRFLDLPATGSVHGYTNLVASGDSSDSFALHNNDLFREGSLSETSLSQFENRSFLTSYYDIGVSGVDQSHWQKPIVAYSQTMIPDSRAFGSDGRPSQSRSAHPGVQFSRPLSPRTSIGTLSSFPHTFAGNALQVEEKPPGSSQISDTVAGRKRKTPSFDALVKETWELHSLFRAGLVADSKKSKSHGNGWVDSRPSSEKGNGMHAINDVPHTGGKWEDRLIWEEEVPSSWKELGARRKETKETISDNKQNDSLVSMDMKQEQYALSVQRSLARRAKNFMGGSSEDLDSEEEFLMDPDDGALNVYDESSLDIKSREEQAYEFFLQMFKGNKDLQKLFHEQCFVGKFECLVCCSIPGKPHKKYRGLISVIMHSSKIMKTKKKQEHRGYARALCSAMGWDICRLPTSKPLDSSPNPRCFIPANEENAGSDDSKSIEREGEL